MKIVRNSVDHGLGNVLSLPSLEELDTLCEDTWLRLFHFGALGLTPRIIKIDG